MIKIRNQHRFDISIDEIANSLGIEVTTVVKKLAFDIFADIVAATPVRTGRAMNNWVISVGSPDRSIVEAGGKKGAIRGAKRAEALSEMAGMQPFDTVWISNNLPYIIPLNEGTSKQAPSGWIDTAIQNNLSQFNGAL